jgi:hypothetical protein
MVTYARKCKVTEIVPLWTDLQWKDCLEAANLAVCCLSVFLLALGRGFWCRWPSFCQIFGKGKLAETC